MVSPAEILERCPILLLIRCFNLSGYEENFKTSGS